MGGRCSLVIAATVTLVERNTVNVVRISGGIVEGAADVQSRIDSNGRRIYTCLAYDCSSVDRHGETIVASAFGPMPAGGIPVLLFHNSASFPVGKVITWAQTARGPVAEFVLADTQEARTAQLLIDGGFLTGVSIGFFASAPEMRGGIPTYTSVEVVELSLTPTPSSRLALIDLQKQIRSIAGDVSAEEASNNETDADSADDSTQGLETRDVDLDTEEELATDEEAATVATDSAEADADVWSLLGLL